MSTTQEVTEPTDSEDILDEELAEFTERMEEVELATRADGGAVEATVVGIRPNSRRGTVEVEFQLPNGEVESERMPEPDRASDEYKFVRICRSVGASISTCHDLLLDSTVEVTEEDGEWRIREPRGRLAVLKDRFSPEMKLFSGEPTSRIENDRFWGKVALTCVGFPVTFFSGLAYLTGGLNDHDSYEYYATGFTTAVLFTSLLAFTAYALIG